MFRLPLHTVDNSIVGSELKHKIINDLRDTIPHTGSPFEFAFSYKHLIWNILNFFAIRPLEN